MFFNYKRNWFSEEGGSTSRPYPAFPAGTGLIETMLFENGAIRFWEQHYARLVQSAVKLGIPHDFSQSALLEMASALVRKNEIRGNCVIRLQAFPKEKEGDSAGFLMECLPPAFDKVTPKVIGIAQGVLKYHDQLSGLKTSSRIPFQVARQQAEAAGWYDALLLNQYGRVAESCISNIFWIARGQIFTPPLSEGCIAGILRQQLLETKLPFPITERPLSLEDLKKAEEVFLTNAVRGLQPVHQFEDREYNTVFTLRLKSKLFWPEQGKNAPLQA
jgi:branched-chain amino acid aminotransferase